MTHDPTLQPDADVRWQIDADAQLKLRFWEDECIVYHGAAGDTHRVPGLVGSMLQCLMQGEAWTAAALSEGIDLHIDDVHTSLTSMHRLGIVHRLA
ncbi:HPr-rel-A system PqqD family peptide chaperone [Pseudorhodoferax sp.]|uniref:HPr-rel-A system PqqD family peptide chaperone n=1 Tax=Pseudorhodoferax sp. TaxID=1993553 RepID=UPI0039E6FDFA